MRNKGLFFTLGVMLVGGVMFAFSLSQDMLSKRVDAFNRVAEVEIASAHATNVGIDLAKAYYDSGGARVVQKDDSVVFTVGSPASLDTYDEEVARLKDASSSLLDVAMDVPSRPEIVTGAGVNFTQASDRVMSFSLPEDLDVIYLDSDIRSVLDNCTMAYEPGNVKLVVNVTGKPGTCRKTSYLNVSGASTLDVNGGGLVLRMVGGSMTLANNLERPVEFSVGFDSNRTGYSPAPVLVCSILAEAGSARKSHQGVAL